MAEFCTRQAAAAALARDAVRAEIEKRRRVAEAQEAQEGGVWSSTDDAGSGPEDSPSAPPGELLGASGEGVLAELPGLGWSCDPLGSMRQDDEMYMYRQHVNTLVRTALGRGGLHGGLAPEPLEDFLVRNDLMQERLYTQGRIGMYNMRAMLAHHLVKWRRMVDRTEAKARVWQEAHRTEGWQMLEERTSGPWTGPTHTGVPDWRGSSESATSNTGLPDMTELQEPDAAAPAEAPSVQRAVADLEQACDEAHRYHEYIRRQLRDAASAAKRSADDTRTEAAGPEHGPDDGEAAPSVERRIEQAREKVRRYCERMHRPSGDTAPAAKRSADDAEEPQLSRRARHSADAEHLQELLQEYLADRHIADRSRATIWRIGGSR